MIAMPVGRLYYRFLEKVKIKALRIHKGDLEHYIPHDYLSKEAKLEILWWEQNVMHCRTPIHRTKPTLTIISDASKTGFGAKCNNLEFYGHWNKQEAELHINVLELLACYLAVKYFVNKLEFKGHCSLKLDNTSALMCINNMGSTKSLELNNLTKKLWMFALDRNIWLSASYVPSASNIADESSRKCLNDSDFMLNRQVFKNTMIMLDFNPEIDLFASRVNYQCKPYVSFKPDIDAKFVDAFSIDWSKYQFYCFPPFNLILKCINKIIEDKATGILVFPKWEAQPFYPLVCRIIVGTPIFLPHRVNLLVHPTVPGRRHRMRVNLIIAKVCGNIWRSKACLPELQKY